MASTDDMASMDAAKYSCKVSPGRGSPWLGDGVKLLLGIAGPCRPLLSI